jgi:trehalose-6-phosphatase
MTSTKVASIFTDYDGTLSPLDAPLSESRIPERIDFALKSLSLECRLAVITSKSFDFIFPRMSYAFAWGCVSGLDIRLSGGSEIVAKQVPGMEDALTAMRSLFGQTVSYEEKRESGGRLLGFSLDWRGGSAPGNIGEGRSTLSKMGLYVSYDDTNPFMDAFCAKPDKGLAMVCMKRASEVGGNAIFMGDSPADNSAFRVAEIPIGVSHGQSTEDLDCEFLVDYDDLSSFLGTLSEKEAVFSPALPGIRRK